MLKKRGICFDLDGTLLNSVEGGQDRFLEVSQKLSLPVKPETRKLAVSFWHNPTNILITSVWPDIDPQKFIDEWQKLDTTELLPIIPDAIMTLRLLSEEFYLSILTNRPRQSTEFQIYHFRHLFDFVITPDDTLIKNDGKKCYKPDPRTMELVIQEYEKRGVKKNSIIFVGDTVSVDYELARITNVSFYAVTSGGCSFKDFLAAGVRQERIISSITELPRLLLY